MDILTNLLLALPADIKKIYNNLLGKNSQALYVSKAWYELLRPLIPDFKIIVYLELDRIGAAGGYSIPVILRDENCKRTYQVL